MNIIHQCAIKFKVDEENRIMFKSLRKIAFTLFSYSDSNIYINFEVINLIPQMHCRLWQTTSYQEKTFSYCTIKFMSGEENKMGFQSWLCCGRNSRSLGWESPSLATTQTGNSWLFGRKTAKCSFQRNFTNCNGSVPQLLSFLIDESRLHETLELLIIKLA